MPNSLTNQTVIFDTIPPRERISHFQLVHRRRLLLYLRENLFPRPVHWLDTRIHVYISRFRCIHAFGMMLATRMPALQPRICVTYRTSIVPEYCSVWRSFAGTSINRESNFYKKKKKKNTSRSVSQTIKRAPTLIFALRLKYCVV